MSAFKFLVLFTIFQHYYCAVEEKPDAYAFEIKVTFDGGHRFKDHYGRLYMKLTGNTFTETVPLTASMNEIFHFGASRKYLFAIRHRISEISKLYLIYHRKCGATSHEHLSVSRIDIFPLYMTTEKKRNDSRRSFCVQRKHTGISPGIPFLVDRAC